MNDQQLFRSVTAEQARVASDYTLDVEVRSFEADYADGTIPEVHVMIIARVIRIADRKLVATVSSDARAGCERRSHERGRGGVRSRCSESFPGHWRSKPRRSSPMISPTYAKCAVRVARAWLLRCRRLPAVARLLTRTSGTSRARSDASSMVTVFSCDPRRVAMSTCACRTSTRRRKSQPYGNTARAALVKLIADRKVFVDVIETDRYGRKVVRVYREPDRLDMVKAMVRDGHVWVYRRTIHDRSLLEFEDAARASHRGLWALPADDRLPPWQYRYLQRQNPKRAARVALESAQASRLHQAIAPVTSGVIIFPGAERGGEARSWWTVVIPQPVEITDQLYSQR